MIELASTIPVSDAFSRKPAWYPDGGGNRPLCQAGRPTLLPSHPKDATSIV